MTDDCEVERLEKTVAKLSGNLAAAMVTLEEIRTELRGLRRRPTNGGPAAYTVKKAAGRMSISEVHLRRLISQGEVEVKRVGRRVLIPAASIERFLDS